jgi:hypothetical protein
VALTADEVRGLWGRLQRGETTLRAERTARGWPDNGRLRRAIVALVGRAAYDVGMKRARVLRNGLERAPRHTHGPQVLPPTIAEALPSGPVMEVDLGGRRVVLVQRIGHAVRLTSGSREERTHSSSVRLGGTVLLPVDAVRTICGALRSVARNRPKRRSPDSAGSPTA